MRKSASAAAACVLALAVGGMLMTIWAKDYWIEKPFTQWNENEALAMLSNSPWAKTQTVAGDYGKAFVPRSIGGAPGAAVSSPSLGPTGGYGGENSTQLYIRWHSSKRVRQAMARIGLLRKVYTEELALKFIEQPVPDFVISISGPAMGPFETLTVEKLKSVTFLLSRKDKTKKIELKGYMSPKQTHDGSALCLFPRLMNDSPCISLEDEEIQFETVAAKTKIRAVFKLARMVVDGELDL